MRKEYDFSKAQRGRFYKKNQRFQITVNLDEETKDHPQFEVFSELSGKYKFRLKTDAGVLFTSNDEYVSKDACLDAISQLRHASVVASTLVAS